MNLLRTIAPLFAGLMALLVLGQNTDLIRCADEVGGTMAVEHHDGGASGTDHAPEPSHGDDAPHAEGLPDCLCHVTFVSTAMVPAMPAPSRLTFLYPALAASPVEGESSPPGHVPLA